MISFRALSSILFNSFPADIFTLFFISLSLQLHHSALAQTRRILCFLQRTRSLSENLLSWKNSSHFLPPLTLYLLLLLFGCLFSVLLCILRDTTLFNDETFHRKTLIQMMKKTITKAFLLEINWQRNSNIWLRSYTGLTSRSNVHCSLLIEDEVERVKI